MGINLTAARGMATAGIVSGMGLTALNAGTAASNRTDSPIGSAASIGGGVAGMMVAMPASNAMISRVAMEGVTTGGKVGAAGAFLGALALAATPGMVLAFSGD